MVLSVRCMLTSELVNNFRKPHLHGLLDSVDLLRRSWLARLWFRTAQKFIVGSVHSHSPFSSAC